MIAETAPLGHQTRRFEPYAVVTLIQLAVRLRRVAFQYAFIVIQPDLITGPKLECGATDTVFFPC